jgi:hypothetical protein
VQRTPQTAVGPIGLVVSEVRATVTRVPPVSRIGTR